MLTKSLLMANFDGIVTDRRITRRTVADFLTRSSDPGARLFGEFTVLHTSGTSGEVGYFLNTDADSARMNLRALRRGPAPVGCPNALAVSGASGSPSTARPAVTTQCYRTS
ncbi:MAG: hypothetical protein WDM77_12215 [Steroidobacteraceae bacterium]